MQYFKQSPYRDLIVGVDTKIPLSNNKLATVINFDNSATTPPLISVMKSIWNFSPWYSSIHRGTGFKSQISSKIYESSRQMVAKFVGADLSKESVVYVKNTTEAINKLSYRLAEQWDSDSVILCTYMEHHSDDLPWREKFKVDYVEVDDKGRLILDDLKDKLDYYKGKVKLVAVTGASNVTGYKNPIHTIAKLAHSHNAKILVDGAQLVPHAPVNMKPHNDEDHIDFLAFSSHKMYAPFGTGVLIAPISLLKEGSPEFKGGGTVKAVTHDYVIWDDPPAKDEAGTPNVLGVLALITAIDTINKVGMKKIEQYEEHLINYGLNKLSKVKDVIIYSTLEDYPRVSIIPFNIKGIHNSIVAQILSSEKGIAVRSGCFCAHPYIHRLLKLNDDEVDSYSTLSPTERPGLVRLSFGMYNDFHEIDVLVNLIKKVVENKDYFIKKYSNKVKA